MEAENPGQAETLYNVKFISLEAMKNAFKSHDSWNDLNDPNSDFCSFLKKECQHEDSENISVFKLRCLGILWCEGDAIEKASELFENMQDGG